VAIFVRDVRKRKHRAGKDEAIGDAVPRNEREFWGGKLALGAAIIKYPNGSLTSARCMESPSEENMGRHGK
jgi:hypothetical protein